MATTTSPTTSHSNTRAFSATHFAHPKSQYRTILDRDSRTQIHHVVQTQKPFQNNYGQIKAPIDGHLDTDLSHKAILDRQLSMAGSENPAIALNILLREKAQIQEMAQIKEEKIKHAIHEIGISKWKVTKKKKLAILQPCSQECQSTDNGASGFG
jgi:endonuclease III